MATQAKTQGTGTESAFSWRFVTPMLLGSALNPVNSSLIATALVPIAAAMHVSVGRTAVLVSGLCLASSIAQPTAGKLSQEFGPRRIFLAGILLVLAGGLVGGFAQDLTTLVIARVLIGIGTSAGYPSAMLLIRRRAAQAGLDAPPGSVLGGLVIAGLDRAGRGRRPRRGAGLVGTARQPSLLRCAAAREEPGAYPHLPALGHPRPVRLHRAVRRHAMAAGRPR